MTEPVRPCEPAYPESSFCTTHDQYLLTCTADLRATVAALQAEVERLTRNNKQLLSERDLANARARNLGDSAHDLETENAALRRVVDAVTYAMKSGCFHPVPGLAKGASTEDLVKWGAMRNLHDAYAALTRPASPPESV